MDGSDMRGCCLPSPKIPVLHMLPATFGVSPSVTCLITLHSPMKMIPSNILESTLSQGHSAIPFDKSRWN